MPTEASSLSAGNLPPRPSRSQRGRRWLRFALPLLAVLGLVWWLVFTDNLERHDLGPGSRVLARPGAPLFLVADDTGGWSAFPADARLPGAAFALPATEGPPVLGWAGNIWVLADGVLSVHGTGFEQGRRVQGVDLAGLGLEDILIVPGAAGASREVPVVSEGTPDGRALSWVDLVAASQGLSAVHPLLDERGERRATVPIGEPVMCSAWGPSLAFRGVNGWEAWTLGASADSGIGTPARSLDVPGAPWIVLSVNQHEPLSVLPRRVVAPAHTGPGAVFSPDGAGLVVQGRRGGGLWLLSLYEGGLTHMAEGNLGRSQRVHASAGIRHDPPRMVNAQWSRDDDLQIFETHFAGGGRMAFKVSFLHNYGVVVDPSGRRMVYAVAEFEEEGDDRFDEDLYLFDFENPSRNAVKLGRRLGGQVGAGPVFVGRDDALSLVYVMDGRVQLVRFAEPPPRS